MTIKATFLATALCVSGAALAWGQTPMLAVAARGDKAVNLYNVGGGGVALQLVKAVPVGESPIEMCLSPNGKRLFASIPASKSVAVIDLDSKTVVGTLSDPGMQAPDGCAASPDSKKLYSVDQTGDAVFVFSVESRQMLKKIPVGKEPRRAVFSPDGKRVVVSNSHSDTLSVIDPSTDTVVSTVKTGNEPRDLAYSPDGKLLAVEVINDDCTQFFKADTLEFKQQAASAWSPQRMEFAPDSRRLYVAGKLANAVSVLRIGPLNRLDDTIPIPYGPLGYKNVWGLAITADGKYLYVSNPGEDMLAVIDTQTLKTVRSYPTGKVPMSIVYIKATGGTASLSAPARMDHYRSLARMATEAVATKDMAAATKLCRTLEQDWDEGERALRQSSPDVWGQVDQALDEFIGPITRSGGVPPSAATLNAVYQNFLAKLKLAG
jgi:YVTN family beta-propeller protein